MVVRLCIDYTKLNAHTKKEPYPIPPVEEMLELLQGAKYLTTLDLCSGYWQVAMDKNSIDKTAFICHRGLFKFKVMPFGLCNAPFVFQRLMDSVLSGLKWRNCLVYLDDIIVASPTFEQHLVDLQEVFGRLRAAGLILNPDKCRIAFQELPFMGHIVGAEGLKTDPDKTNAVVKFPEPRNLTSLRKFLGMAGWYRRFIAHFSDIVAPLNELTRKGVSFRWTNVQRDAFLKLKHCLVNAPVMCRPDFTRPFSVQTDASDVGLGAILAQSYDDGDKVVAYASRSLSTVERRYSTVEKECLAVLFAVEKFRPYLEGRAFTIITDHHSLQWLMKRREPNGRLARWSLRLQAYTFSIKHRPGSQNSVPDALSRFPHDQEEPFVTVSAITTTDDSPTSSCAPNPMTGITLEEFREALNTDQYTKKILQRIPSQPEKYPLFKIVDGCLFRYVADQYLLNHLPELSPWRLVVPQQYRQQLLEEHHDSPCAGHMGILKTYRRLAPYYFWPQMKKDVQHFVTCCIKCQMHKPVNAKPMGLMIPNVSDTPWKIVAVDLVGPLPRTSQGNRYILVALDTCTKWVELFALRKSDSYIIAKLLKEQIFFRFGVPEILLSDNASVFSGSVMQNLSEELGFKRHFITPYHPQSNPTERSIRDIRPMLAMYVGSDHTTWDKYLPEFGFALRTAVHNTTGYPPAYLNLGRLLHLPHQLLNTGILEHHFAPLNANQVVPNVSSDLEYAFHVAKINIQHAKQKQKYYYDQKRRPSTWKTGDMAWIKNHPVSSGHKRVSRKLSPLYVGPYLITDVLSEVNVRLADATTLEDIGTFHVSELKPAIIESWAPIAEDSAQSV